MFFDPVVFLAFVPVAAGFAAYFVVNSRVGSTDGERNLLVERGPQCAASLEIEQEDFQSLYEMGMALGLEYPATFARVVDYLYDENRLPNCYLTKRQARSMGWGGGRTVAIAVPSHSIGEIILGTERVFCPQNTPEIIVRLIWTAITGTGEPRVWFLFRAERMRA